MQKRKIKTPTIKKVVSQLYVFYVRFLKDE